MVGGHDPDDLEFFSVENDFFLKRVWIAAEHALPQAVAENCNMIAAGMIFSVGKSPAKERSGTKNREKVCLAKDAQYALGFSGAAHVDVVSLSEDDHVFERLVLRAPIQEIGSGQRRKGHGALGLPELDEALRLAERQRAKQDGVNHAEDGR